MTKQDLLDRLTAVIGKQGKRAVVPVPEDRIPLFLNQTRVGHLTKDDAAFLSDRYDFAEIRDGRCTLQAEDSADATNKFRGISLLFRDMGRVRAWRDELLPVVEVHSMQMEPHLAVIERAMCRPFAMPTFAVHLNPFTADGRLWVGQRAMTKKIGPGYWDNCAAGIVSFGEEFAEAMERESWEEAGIKPGSVKFTYDSRHVISRPVTEGWMTEHTLIFLAEVSDDFVPVNVDGEVQKFELLTPLEVIERVEEGKFTFESSLSVLLAIASKAGLRTAWNKELASFV